MNQAPQPGKSGASPQHVNHSRLAELSAVHVRFMEYLGLCPDWVTDEAHGDLMGLRSNVEPTAWPRIRETMMASLGSSRSRMISHIDPKPSQVLFFAQDHHAVLEDGRHVIVRVQRPGAPEALAEALSKEKTLFAAIHSFLRPHAPSRPLILRQFELWARREMDFRGTLRDHLRQHKSHHASAIAELPAPVPELCTSQVYVMEHVPGDVLSQQSKFRDQGLAATNLLLFVLRQSLRDGHFNTALLNDTVRFDGIRVSLRNFALSWQLDEKLRRRLLRLLLALRNRDYDQCFIAFKSIFEPSDRANAASFRLGFMGLSKLVGEGEEWLDPAMWICEGMAIAYQHGYTLTEAPQQALRGLVLAYKIAHRLAPNRDRSEEADFMDSLLMDHLAARLEVEGIARDFARLHKLYFNASRGVNQLLEDQDEGRFTLPIELGEGPNTALNGLKRARLIAMSILSIGLAWLLTRTDLPSIMGWDLKWPTLGCLLILYAWIMLQTRRL